MKAPLMTPTDTTRLHERIDALEKFIQVRFDALGEKVTRNIAMCEDCRPRVLGNGREGLVQLVTRHETTIHVLKWVIGLLVAVGSMVVAAGTMYATFK
jgi:hypothetical protein